MNNDIKKNKIPKEYYPILIKLKRNTDRSIPEVMKFFAENNFDYDKAYKAIENDVLPKSKFFDNKLNYSKAFVFKYCDNKKYFFGTVQTGCDSTLSCEEISTCIINYIKQTEILNNKEELDKILNKSIYKLLDPIRIKVFNFNNLDEYNIEYGSLFSKLQIENIYELKIFNNIKIEQKNSKNKIVEFKDDFNSLIILK